MRANIDLTENRDFRSRSGKVTNDNFLSDTIFEISGIAITGQRLFSNKLWYVDKKSSLEASFEELDKARDLDEYECWRCGRKLKVYEGKNPICFRCDEEMLNIEYGKEHLWFKNR